MYRGANFYQKGANFLNKGANSFFSFRRGPSICLMSTAASTIRPKKNCQPMAPACKQPSSQKPAMLVEMFGSLGLHAPRWLQASGQRQQRGLKNPHFLFQGVDHKHEYVLKRCLRFLLFCIFLLLSKTKRIMSNCTSSLSTFERITTWCGPLGASAPSMRQPSPSGLSTSTTTARSCACSPT